MLSPAKPAIAIRRRRMGEAPCGTLRLVHRSYPSEGGSHSAAKDGWPTRSRYLPTALHAVLRAGATALRAGRVVIEDFRCQYNHYRPHSKLGYLSPSRFAAQWAPSPTVVGLRPPFVGDGQIRTHDLLSTTDSD